MCKRTHTILHCSKLLQTVGYMYTHTYSIKVLHWSLTVTMYMLNNTTVCSNILYLHVYLQQYCIVVYNNNSYIYKCIYIST